MNFGLPDYRDCKARKAPTPGNPIPVAPAGCRGVVNRCNSSLSIWRNLPRVGEAGTHDCAIGSTPISIGESAIAVAQEWSGSESLNRTGTTAVSVNRAVCSGGPSGTHVVPDPICVRGLNGGLRPAFRPAGADWPR